jgi:hypothetical protein
MPADDLLGFTLFSPTYELDAFLGSEKAKKTG